MKITAFQLSMIFLMFEIISWLNIIITSNQMQSTKNYTTEIYIIPFTSLMLSIFFCACGLYFPIKYWDNSDTVICEIK